MKTVLTERTEMAKAINFGKYPVLSIDLDNQPYKEDLERAGRKESYIVGCKCRVDWGRTDRFKGMSSRCTLVMENDVYKLTSGGACLKASYGMSDFLEDIENASTPLVHKGETVAVAHYSKELGVKFVRLMRVGDRIDPNCITVVTLEEITE